MIIKTKTVVLILCLVLTLPAFHGARADESPSLRDTLEQAWKAHLEASRTGQVSELEKTMSAFSLGTMKNRLISANRSLTPEIIKSLAAYGPDIFSARFLTLLENGDTAGLVYVTDSGETDGGGNPRVVFSFIKFVQEPTGWKVALATKMNKPKYDDNGKKSLFPLAEIPLAGAIDGQVKPAPAPVQAPYASALLDVSSYGYETRITVNGVQQGAPVHASRSGVLSGGLCKGENTVKILIARTQTEACLPPAVQIRRVLQNRTTKEVFHFNPKKKIEGTHSFTFNIRN